MSRNRAYPAVVALLALMAGLGGVVGNIASSRLPKAVEPYLWLAWPLFVLLTLSTIGLVLWQNRLERESGSERESNEPPAWIPQLADALRSVQPAGQQTMAAATEPSRIPSNLPAPGEFIGRLAEKTVVHEALRSASPLIVIDGFGGIGKTSLAKKVAAECLANSQGESSDTVITRFKGFIWTTAKDQELTLPIFLDTIARTLGYPGIVQQALEERRTSVRNLLQEKSYLIVVDNFETITDADVENFLLSFPDPSKALITTRKRTLPQARVITLERLKEQEALTLIRSRGRDLNLASVVTAKDEVLSRLNRLTDGSPLAIKWAVGQMGQRGESLDTVLAALRSGHGALFDDIFSRSWTLLSDDARTVLMIMPVFVTSASRGDIEAASDVRGERLNSAMGQLVEMSLLDASDDLEEHRKRFTVHPLTRSFSAAHLVQQPEVEEAAKHRLAIYLNSLAAERGQLWDRDGFALLELELPNVLACIKWCWQADPRLGVELVLNIRHVMIHLGYWSDVLAIGLQAVEQAEALGDHYSAARLRVRPLGWVYRHRGELEAAEFQVLAGLRTCESLGDSRRTADAKRNLGRIAHGLGQFDRAESLLQQALAYFISAKDEYHIYMTTAGLAELAIDRGDLDTAWALSESAMEPARADKYPVRLGRWLVLRADVAHARGDFAQAELLWQEALAIMQEAMRSEGIPDCYLGLGNAELKLGKVDLAKQHLLQARDLYRRLDIRAGVQEADESLALI